MRTIKIRDALDYATDAALKTLDAVYAECARQTSSQNRFNVGRKSFTICAGHGEKHRAGGGIELVVEDTNPIGQVRAVGSFIILPDGTIPFGPFSRLKHRSKA